MAQDYSPTATGSSPMKLVIYWAIVAVPLTWGVYKTVIKSQPLFTGASATALATPSPAAAPIASTPAPLATVAPASSPAATAPPPGT